MTKQRVQLEIGLNVGGKLETTSTYVEYENDVNKKIKEIQKESLEPASLSGYVQIGEASLKHSAIVYVKKYL